jgi:cilia- and flagella-associated protein 57
MGAGHVEELNIITASLAQEKEQHQKALAELESKFHQKIIVEYEKAVTVKKYTEEMRESYEEKLKKATHCLQDAVCECS